MIKLLMDNRVLLALEQDIQKSAEEFANTRNLREPFLEIAGTVLAPSITKNFQLGGRPNRWEAVLLDSNYRRKHSGSSDTPLWVTGKLKNAAGAKVRFTVRANVMTYGNFPNASWFAGVHDAGSTKAEVPARPFAVMQTEDIDQIVRIFGEWVERQINKHVKLRYA